MIPTTIRLPEGIREAIGRRLNLLSATCNDILATAYHLLGFDPRTLNGEFHSLRDPLRGTGKQPVDLVTFEVDYEPRDRGIRDPVGRARGLRSGQYARIADQAKNAWELYDLRDDPLEANNLAKADVARVKELAAKLAPARTQP